MIYEDLDGRTLVLETKVKYIEDSVSKQSEQFQTMCDGMTEVREHIAKQNGALPRIESYARETKERLDQFEETFSIQMKEENEHVKKDAIEKATFSLKQKAIWAIVGAVVTGGLYEGAVMVIRHFFG